MFTCRTSQCPPLKSSTFRQQESSVLYVARHSLVVRKHQASGIRRRVNLYIGIARAERDGTRAETRFRLSPKRTGPFKSVGASVQSTAGSRGVRISGSITDKPRSEGVWEYWLPTPFASFPFTSPPVRHGVPPGSERALPNLTAEGAFCLHLQYILLTTLKMEAARSTECRQLYTKLQDVISQKAGIFISIPAKTCPKSRMECKTSFPAVNIV